MRRLGSLGIALLVIGVAEIALLIAVARWLGLGAVILLVLATSLLGAVLLRREGVRTWRRFREVAAQGGRPGVAVGGGLAGLLASVLLILPGFLTDLVGLALLVPPVRRVAAVGVRRFVERRLTSADAGDLFGPRRVRVRTGRPTPTPPGTGAAGTGPTGAGPTTIEGEIIDRES